MSLETNNAPGRLAKPSELSTAARTDVKINKKHLRRESLNKVF